MVQLWRFAPVCMKWKLSAFYSGSLLKHFNRHICHTSNHCLETGAPLAHFSLFSSTFSSACLCWDHQPPSTATKSKQNASLNVFNEKFSHRAFAQQRRPRRRRGCMVQWLWVAVLVFPVQLLLDASAAANKKTFTSFRNVFSCQLVS